MPVRCPASPQGSRPSDRPVPGSRRSRGPRRATRSLRESSAGRSPFPSAGGPHGHPAHRGSHGDLQLQRAPGHRHRAVPQRRIPRLRLGAQRRKAETWHSAGETQSGECRGTASPRRWHGGTQRPVGSQPRRTRSGGLPSHTARVGRREGVRGPRGVARVRPDWRPPPWRGGSESVYAESAPSTVAAVSRCHAYARPRASGTTVMRSLHGPDPSAVRGTVIPPSAFVSHVASLMGATGCDATLEGGVGRRAGPGSAPPGQCRRPAPGR